MRHLFITTFATTILAACSSEPEVIYVDGEPIVITETHTITDTVIQTVEVPTEGTDEPDTEVHSCDNPTVTVISQLVMSPKVTGDEGTLIRLLIASGPDESVNLTDLTLTLASDDTTETYGFDQIPQPSDHITNCSLVDGWGRLIAGPNAVDTSGQVAFSDFEELIYRDNVLALDLSCSFTHTDVVNDDSDGYTAYVADVSDMTFEIALVGSAVTEQEICLPNGLPNANLASKVTVMQTGDMLIMFNGPTAGNLSVGTLNAIHDTIWSASFEDQKVEQITYQLHGDVDIVEMIWAQYINSSGNLLSVGAMWSPDGLVTINAQDLHVETGFPTNVELWVKIDPLAQPGESVSATLLTVETEVIGMTSDETIRFEDFTPQSDIAGYTFIVL